MVPGLDIEEFSTPPSSPVLATRTRKKAAVPTPDSESVDYKSTRDPSNDLQDSIQLGELYLDVKIIMVTVVSDLFIM